MKAQLQKNKQSTSKWMTLRQVAEHYQVSERTIRRAQGHFRMLKKVNPTPGRTLIPRSSVETLDALLEREARSTVDVLKQFDQREAGSPRHHARRAA